MYRSPHGEKFVFAIFLLHNKSSQNLLLETTIATYLPLTVSMFEEYGMVQQVLAWSSS